MMAAYSAAAAGHRVRLFDKNEKLGKKAVYHRKGAVQYYQRRRRLRTFLTILFPTNIFYTVHFTRSIIRI